jgi:5-methylcytosine-specific restriction protein A
MKNPPWSRDEHIIALDFYLRYAPTIPGKDFKEVIALSELLNILGRKITGDLQETYRNPAGVYMKLMNFRGVDPSYPGVGLANGSKDEQVVWDLYSNNRTELSRLANHIAQFITTGTSTEALPELSDDEEEGNEGQVLSRVHRYRERDRKLVTKKKAKFLLENSKLHCEACGFDFKQRYGERGADFIECHHTKPVSELESNGKTKISDLVLLCSNCHRIVHRKKPWLSFEELIDLVKAA